ncbi:MAG: phosphoglucomutase/phosphomannomutase family protein, partial [Coriobacteriales bacterium]|nr:phosphoglucomutase/phosphomannomutase family protein [Coriobacteriales bacterium]
GEESGGFGIPTHVRERDGLLMALLLVEMMASRSKTLAELVEELLQQVGTLEYGRRDLRLSEAQKAVFLSQHVNVAGTDYSPYSPLFTSLNEEIFEIERVDGIMIRFVSDAWLLARPSGTEPLVRVYAEAANDQRVQELLDIGCAMAEGLL